MTKNPEDKQPNSKKGISEKLLDVLSFVISLLALGFSLATWYFSELNPGNIKIYPPSRIGYARTSKLVHGHQGDKIVLTFVIHNDGNKTRTFKSSKLFLKKIDPKIDQKEEPISTFDAAGRFEKLKDITKFTEADLESKYDYYLITAIPLGKNEYQSVTFLYLHNKLKLREGFYMGKVSVSFFGEKEKEECFSFKVPEKFKFPLAMLKKLNRKIAKRNSLQINKSVCPILLALQIP
jgi:hypothetical protein